jgi:serine/threonine protein phosphatase PrpC
MWPFFKHKLRPYIFSDFGVRSLCNAEDLVFFYDKLTCAFTSLPFSLYAIFDAHGNDPNFLNKLKSLPISHIVSTSLTPCEDIQQILISDPSLSIFSGSTLSLILIFNNKIKIYTVGDSKVYIWKNHSLAYVSPQHNAQNLHEIQRLISEDKVFHIKPEIGIQVIHDDLISLDRNSSVIDFDSSFSLAMTQSIGHKGLTGLLPDVFELHFFDYDNIILVAASDGIWDMLNMSFPPDIHLIQSSSVTHILDFVENRWKKQWNMIDNGIIYPKQTFPYDGYDDLALVVWKHFL